MRKLETANLRLRKFSFTVIARKSTEKTNLVTLQGRIAYNGTRANDFSLGMKILAKHWNSDEQCITGKKYEKLNSDLQQIRHDIGVLHSDFLRTNQPFTAEDIRKAYTTKDKPLPTVLEVYSQFIDEKELLQTARKIEKSTLKRYESFRITFSNYLKNVCKAEKMPMIEFDRAQADKFVLHLSTNKNSYNRYNNKNYISRSLRMLKQVFKWAVEREIIEKNPLQYYKVERAKAENQVFLEADEVERVEALKPTSSTLQRALDLFLFQIHTGLGYEDTQDFDYEKHIVTQNNTVFIRMARGKTDIITLVPLFPKANEILKKYDNDMKNTVLNLGKYNKYLKEVAALANIDKIIASHVGRRTAGYMWLNAGISMEVVSRMLGHASIRETEKIYAKVLPSYIVSETSKFHNKQLLSYEKQQKG
jgi:site-specific recombinase XerD